MSTCYPQPGSVKIVSGETLVLDSIYSSSQGHTGVMGLFYLLVADQLPNFLLNSQSPVLVRSFPFFFPASMVIDYLSIHTPLLKLVHKDMEADEWAEGECAMRIVAG